MINMAFMPLCMWEMCDVMPVTHGRTVESRTVFCLSRIRKNHLVFGLNNVWMEKIRFLNYTWLRYNFFTHKLRMLLDWTPSHIILPLHLADLMAVIFLPCVCLYFAEQIKYTVKAFFKWNLNTLTTGFKSMDISNKLSLLCRTIKASMSRRSMFTV